jgi:hypothetical protein
MGDLMVRLAAESRNELHEMKALVKAWLASPLDLIVLYLSAFAEDDSGKEKDDRAERVEAG